MTLLLSRYYLLLAALLLVFVKAEAHPYHLSLAEIKYNAKTQTLEVALKIFTDDLEKTLSVEAKKPVVINQSAEVQQLVEAYLKNNFQLEISANQIVTQRLIGYEGQADSHWFFLEMPIKPEQLNAAKLRNQVLIETFSDQVNMANLEINGQKRTLLFKEGEVLKPLL